MGVVVQNVKKHGAVIELQKDIKIIFHLLSRRRKLQLLALLLVQIFGGILEVISLGALIPFISVIDNVSEYSEVYYVNEFLDYINIHEDSDVIILFSVLFVGVFLIVNVFKVTVVWFQNEMAVVVGRDVSKIFYSKVLAQSYEDHIRQSSGVLISRVSNDLGGVIGFINHCLSILTNLFSVIALALAIFAFDPIASLIVFFVVPASYFFVDMANKRRMVSWGRKASDFRAKALCALQAGLGGIRDVILGQKHEYFVRTYVDSDRIVREAAAKVKFFSALPRYVLEVLGTCVLVAVAVYYSAFGEVKGSILSLIGAFAMATVRMLPASQAIYNSYAALQNAHVSVDRALSFLNKETSALKGVVREKFTIEDAITLKDVWYRFADDNGNKLVGNWVLRGVSLTFPVNQTVALVGETGSGKTTVSDLLLGLLVPEEGGVFCDQERVTLENLGRYYNSVSSVPQSIYILDDTVMANIAFGEQACEIDFDRVKEACVAARIHDLIISRPLGYNEVLGENGLRLSGGQRQRIGIARALYKKSSLLVMDEATSALDNQTEKSVMETLQSLHGKQTIVLIAHRLDTVKSADIIYEMRDGVVVASGSFHELLRKSKTFAAMVNVM